MRVVVSSELGYSIADCGVVGNRAAEANAALIALAPTAPHDCDDPQCPGDINRRKLESFDEIYTLAGLLLCEVEEHSCEYHHQTPEHFLAAARAALKQAEEASRAPLPEAELNDRKDRERGLLPSDSER